MPLHAGVPGALPDGGVIRERALRFHLGNYHKTIYLHRSSKYCFPYAGFFIADGQARGMTGQVRGRGAPRRRIKALTGVKHHVRPAEFPVEQLTWCPATKDQGLDGRGSTTSDLPNSRPASATWCPETKDQGFDGREAPRPTHRIPGRSG